MIILKPWEVLFLKPKLRDGLVFASVPLKSAMNGEESLLWYLVFQELFK